MQKAGFLARLHGEEDLIASAEAEKDVQAAKPADPGAPKDASVGE